jgi:formylmethanofuran dehydrogenase subunit B
MAILSGASLTTEKTYLMGKFARVCLKTAHIDYNGRLCMVSAAAGNKKAFGIDRAANPWIDMLGAEVVWISGANVAECAPITTNYVWQAREQGAKIIVVDPRITPIARTCDLFLPVKPGRDIALFNGILDIVSLSLPVTNSSLSSAATVRVASGTSRMATNMNAIRHTLLLEQVTQFECMNHLSRYSAFVPTGTAL